MVATLNEKHEQLVSVLSASLIGSTNVQAVYGRLVNIESMTLSPVVYTYMVRARPQKLVTGLTATAPEFVIEVIHKVTHATSGPTDAQLQLLETTSTTAFQDAIDAIMDSQYRPYWGGIVFPLAQPVVDYIRASGFTAKRTPVLIQMI